MGAYWIFMYLMETVSPSLEMKTFFNYLKYIGIIATPTLFLLFSLKYSRSRLWINKLFIGSIWIYPIGVLLMNWTDPLHDLLRRNERILEVGGLSLFRYDATLLQDLLNGGLVLFAVLGVIILLSGLKNKRSDPKAVFFIIAAVMLPIVGEIIALITRGDLHYIDVPPFLFIFTTILVLVGIMKFDLFHISSLPREDVIDNMKEAVISIDDQGMIVDINETVRKYFDLEDENVFETSIYERLPKIADLMERMEKEGVETGFLEFEHGPYKYIEVRISTQTDQRGKTIGKVIILEDETDKKSMSDRIEKERKAYLSTLDNIDDWVWEITVNGTFTYSNKAVEKILGYSPEEVVGNRLTMFWDKKDLIPLKIKDTQDYLSKGKPWKGQYFRYQHKDGRTVLVESTGNPIYDAKGKFTGYRGVDRDVTSKEQWALKLRENAHNFINILRMIPVGVLIVRKKTARIFFINKSLENMFGLPEEEIVGKRLKDMITEYGIKIIDINGKEGEIRDYRSVLINREGKMIPLEISRTNITLDDEEKEIMTFIDLEDQIKAKESQEKMNEFLKQVNKILRHDISNDLMIVNNSALMFQRTGNEEHLDHLQNSIERSHDLINKMKELEDTLSLDNLLQRYDARSILTEISKDFDMEIKIDGEGTIRADNAIFSVFRNIISNSQKHGMATSIIIEIKDNEEMCSISFADNGKGIPLELINMVFEEGYSYGENRGTGIGLFMVSKTMERYGGSVIAESNHPSGIKFTLSFPSK
jgi:PAS domain S-box-containing protein